MVYVASLNDQVVPSGFSFQINLVSRFIVPFSVLGAVHDCIAPTDLARFIHRWRCVPVRSLFSAVRLYLLIHGCRSSDFLSNLLVLLLRVMNSGISDSGLLAHLSEATAGSLNGIGHSTAYEELATYS
jgi:hypothetical protein